MNIIVIVGVLCCMIFSILYIKILKPHKENINLLNRQLKACKDTLYAYIYSSDTCCKFCCDFYDDRLKCEKCLWLKFYEKKDYACFTWLNKEMFKINKKSTNWETFFKLKFSEQEDYKLLREKRISMLRDWISELEKEKYKLMYKFEKTIFNIYK